MCGCQQCGWARMNSARSAVALREPGAAMRVVTPEPEWRVPFVTLPRCDHPQCDESASCTYVLLQDTPVLGSIEVGDLKVCAKHESTVQAYARSRNLQVQRKEVMQSAKDRDSDG